MAQEGIGGRRHRRRWLWLGGCAGALLVASLAYAVRQVSGAPKPDPADTAALLGLPVAIAALLAGVLALRRAPEGDLANLSRGWAATLAAQVENSEKKQWRQLLGDDTQRINLAFTLQAAPTRTATAPAEAGRLFEGTPTVPDVAAYYRRTRPRRLVVTGAPGAGKTVLALELMLALLEGRGEDEPVPVRVPLAEWDTRVPLAELLAGRLVDVYDWDPARADALVRHRRVLPVLDGLDEMDATRPDGTPSPDGPRALAALDALNAYQEGRDAGPLVLTCRTAHYDALAPHTRLMDAARVGIDAVPALDARTYLRARTGTPARWEPVLTALHDDPAGPLATTLSTPWRLCLAATVYARDGDPAELLHHATPEDLDAHLLARFIPRPPPCTPTAATTPPASTTGSPVSRPISTPRRARPGRPAPAPAPTWCSMNSGRWPDGSACGRPTPCSAQARPSCRGSPSCPCSVFCPPASTRPSPLPMPEYLSPYVTKWLSRAGSFSRTCWSLFSRLWGQRWFSVSSQVWQQHVLGSPCRNTLNGGC